MGVKESCRKMETFFKHPCQIKIYTKINIFWGNDVVFCKAPNMKQVNKSHNG